LAGRVVPEVDEPDVREVFFRTYRIVYRVMEGEVHVLTVFEGSRPLLVETMSDETGSRE
jgi:plasmid stabilization system protein ParE